MNFIEQHFQVARHGMFGEVEMLEMIKEAKGQTDPLSVRSTPACRPAKVKPLDAKKLGVKMIYNRMLLTRMMLLKMGVKC